MRALILIKRLLKKKGFLICLLMMPVASLLISLVASRDVAVVRVAFCCPEECRIAAERLEGEDSSLRFIECASPEETESLVYSGRADVGWVFPKDLFERLKAFADGKRKPVVTVYNGSDSLAGVIAKEHLFFSVYPELSFEACLDFTEKAMGTAPDAALLKKAFDNAATLDGLIEISTVSGGSPHRENAVTSVLRGFLSLCCLVASLSSAVFAVSDITAGRLAAAGTAKKLAFTFITVFAASLLSCAVLVACLAASDLTLFSAFDEALCSAVLVLALTGFSLLVGFVSGSPRRLCALIMPIVAAAFVLSPVFFSAASVRSVQRFFPLTWYLELTVSAERAGEYFILSSALLALSIICGLFFIKKSRERGL